MPQGKEATKSKASPAKPPGFKALAAAIGKSTPELEAVWFDKVSAFATDGRFGIQIVASPRHADGLLITGPVTANMRLALQKTYDAIPAPKLVIAVGACAISGGPYVGHPEAADGADAVVPVDLYIPGCPPHPYTILDGLLRLLGRIEKDA